MAALIDRIYADHRNTARLLHLMEREAARLERGEHTDFNLLVDVMGYFVNYPDLYHHPLEDRMFTALKEKDRNMANLIDQVYGEHQHLAADSAHLLDTVTQVRANAMFSREALLKELRGYTALYWNHMRLEEDKLLPGVESQLDEADWQAVEDEASAEEDPVFGVTLNEQYQALYKAILAESEERS